MENIAIIFDFDLTLTAHHMSKILSQKENINFLHDLFHTNQPTSNDHFVATLFGGLKRISMLHSALKYCAHYANDIDVFILSFGNTSDIASVLQTIDLLDCFKLIIGNVGKDVIARNTETGDEYKLSNARPKLSTIEEEVIKIRKYTRIIFIDDDKTNIESMKSHNNIKTIHVDSLYGMTHAHFVTLFQYVAELRNTKVNTVPENFIFPDKSPDNNFRGFQAHGCLLCENTANFYEEISDNYLCSIECQELLHQNRIIS